MTAPPFIDDDTEDPGLRAVLNGVYDPSPEVEQEARIQSRLLALRAAEEAKRRFAAEQSASEATGERGGWVPVDLTPLLDGTAQKVLPEIGRRHDGVRLIYRGKEHSIASEPECGKTWFALLQVIDILKQGGRVLYVDFEDDEATIVGRLLALGLLPARLRPDAGQFRYARPEAAHEVQWLVDLLRFDDTWADMVIYDGMTEGMQLWGLNPLEQLAVAMWRKLLIRPALKVGTATLTTDHVVKNREARGGYAIGAQHKLAGLTGAQYLMERVDPFGRGLKGRSRLLVSKDRNGGLRQHGFPVEGHPGITYMGDLVGDATGGEMESLILWPPREDGFPEEVAPEEPEADPKFQRLLDDIVATLAIQAKPLSFNDIKARVTGSDARLRQALARLEDDEQIVVIDGPRKSKLHSLRESGGVGEAA